MRWLFRLLGCAAGFAVGIVLVELVFANNASWPDVVPFALGVAGWLLGDAAGQRLRIRAARQPVSPR
jgi:uncharacterized membrane protein YccC